MNLRETMQHIMLGRRIVESDVLSMKPADLENIHPSLFKRDLTNLYEIEYKLFIINKAIANPTLFKGMPKRLENIERIYKKKAIEHVRVIATVLKNVFGDWLKAHAINNPEDWAAARAEEHARESFETGDNPFDGPVYEYNDRYATLHGIHYAHTPYNPTGHRRKELSDILIELYRQGVFPSKMPNTFDALEIYVKEFYNMIVEQYKDEIDSFEGDEEDMPQEPIPYEGNIEHYMHEWMDTEGLSPEVQENILYDANIEEVLKELYLYAVWPLWWAVFEPEGIVDTRERVENAYQELVKLADQTEYKKDMLARLNIIKNIAHQSGSMLDYLQEWVDGDYSDERAFWTDEEDLGWDTFDVKTLFNELTSTSEETIEEWNEELRKVGFDI